MDEKDVVGVEDGDPPPETALVSRVIRTDELV